MKTEVQIIKVTQDGEQISVKSELEQEEVSHHISKGRTLRQVFDPYFALVDDRLLEMNTRIMASNAMVAKLTPEGQMAVHNIFETLFGKISNEEMAKIIEEAKAQQQAERDKKLAVGSDGKKHITH